MIEYRLRSTQVVDHNILWKWTHKKRDLRCEGLCGLGITCRRINRVHLPKQNMAERCINISQWPAYPGTTNMFLPSAPQNKALTYERQWLESHSLAWFPFYQFSNIHPHSWRPCSYLSSIKCITSIIYSQNVKNFYDLFIWPDKGRVLIWGILSERGQDMIEHLRFCLPTGMPTLRPSHSGC